MIANEYEVSFGGDENVVKLMVVMVSQVCVHARNH